MSDRDRLTQSLTLRLSPRQLSRIRARAAHEHRTAGAYLRTRLHDLHHVEEQETVLASMKEQHTAYRKTLDQERERLEELRRELAQRSVELDQQEERILSF